MKSRVQVSQLTGRSHLDHWAVCQVPIIKGGYMPNPPRQLPVAPGGLVPLEQVPLAPKTKFRRPPWNGCVIYEGPSLITGKPIVAIAIGFQDGSENRKTGPMIQTFILCADMPPQEAIDTGADDAICGECPARGVGIAPLERPRPRAYRKRGSGWEHGEGVGQAWQAPEGRFCYVVVAQSPTNVWWKYWNGGYPRVSLQELAYYTWGRNVRFGTYGDPAAVPTEVWATMAESANYVLAYTHQWRLPSAQPLRQWAMASTNSEEDLREATAMGWRSFRMLKAGEQLVPGIEITCPASDEHEEKKGKKAKCIECRSCQGLASKSRRSVAIREHGYLVDPGGRKKRTRREKENPDEDLRALERRVQLGDQEALARLQAAQLRSGVRQPQRKYLIDLAGEVLGEIGGAGLASRSDYLDRKIHAAAIKAVLKQIGVKASVTTPNYAWASSVEIKSARKVPGWLGEPTHDHLNFDESRTIWDAFGLESWEEPKEERRANWRGMQNFSLYPNAREDRSDPRTDYFSPGGPRLREDLWDVYKAALRKELAKPPRAKKPKKQNPWVSGSDGIPENVRAHVELTDADGIPYWRYAIGEGQLAELDDEDPLMQNYEEIEGVLRSHLEAAVAFGASHPHDGSVPHPRTGDMAHFAIGNRRWATMVTMYEPGVIKLGTFPERGNPRRPSRRKRGRR